MKSRRSAGAETLERVAERDGLVAYRSPALDDLGVPHLFPTRRGGDAGESMDLGALDDSSIERLARAAGSPGARLVRIRQVHGRAVWIDDGRDPAEPPAADALVTDRPGRLLRVLAADCVPVLAASADGTQVAAIHAGWRGLVAGVIPAALDRLGPAAAAAIGPCLSVERFEVGPEVAEAFAEAGLGGAVVELPGASRPHVDLRAAAREQLRRLGVQRIDVSDRCTWEQEDELFSHRRDVTHGPLDRTGRCGGLIAPRSERAGRSPRGA